MYTFEYKGFWWKPDQPVNQLFGTLRRTAEGRTTLELAGALGRFEERLPIILGLATTGVKITLCDAFGIESQGTNITEPKEMHTYFVHEAIIGAHFDNSDSIAFEKVSVQFDGLFDWSPFVGAGYSIVTKNEKTTGITASADFSDAIETNINGLKIGLHHLTSTSTKIGELTISSSASFEIDFGTLTKLDDILLPVRRLQDLLTFSLQTPISMKSLSAYRQDVFSYRIKIIDNKPVSTDRKDLEKILLYLPERSLTSDSSKFYLGDAILLLRRGHLPFDILVSKWFKFEEELRAVKTAYLFTIYNEKIMVDDKFFQLCIALESYHRETQMGEVFAKSAFKSLSKTMLTAILDDAQRQIIKDRIGCINTFRFGDRLKAIFSQVEDMLKMKDVDSCIKKILATRNYSAHGDKLRNQNSLNGPKLYYYTELMSVILQILILRYLGCKDEAIKGSLKNRQYHFLKKALGDEIESIF